MISKKPLKFKKIGCGWCKTNFAVTWRNSDNDIGILCNACYFQWKKGNNKEHAKQNIKYSRGLWF